MNLILHIFRKDTRHLYPEILVTLAFTATFAWVAPVQWHFGSIGIDLGASAGGIAFLLSPLLRILLPISWLVLISRLIHDESPVGDRQFWITRPYTWPTLLASKLLFLLVFLYVPFILMQLYLLHHAGLDISAALPDLLHYQLRLTLVFFLPLIAIATVTSNFARLALSILVALLYLVGVFALGTNLYKQHMLPPHVVTFCAILFSAALAAITLVQYATRRTRAARLSLIGLPLLLWLVVIVAPSRTLIDRAYPALPEATSPKLAFDPNALRQEPGSGAPIHFENGVVLSLPIQQIGTAPGLRYKAHGIAITIDTAQGFHWASPFVNDGTDLYAASKTPVVEFTLPGSVFDRIRDLPVSVHLQIAAAVYSTGSPQTALASPPSLAAPGRGLCPLYPDTFATACRYAYRLPAPIDISAEVFTHPCGLTPTPASAAQASAPSNPWTTSGPILVKTFIGSDDTDHLAFDFDPITTTPLNFALPPSATNSYQPGYLCAGAPITFTPHQLTNRVQLFFDIHNLVLAPYARRQRSPATAQ